MKNRKATIAKIIIITAVLQGGGLLLGWFATRQNEPDISEQARETIVSEAAEEVPSTDELDLVESVKKESEEKEDTSNPAPVVPTDPEPTFTANILDCGSDCTFAPVDKENALPSTYNPGGLTTKTRSALSGLKAAAKADGVSVATISEFRSYSKQKSTFEYWVQTEVNKGNSRSKAEEIANTYSARPGHSEHQLGTTIDVKCTGCSDWGDDNDKLYDWIEDNAHKHGFVVSYPKNSQNLTGYTYEPWHIRWIGVDLAGELYDTGYITGNGNYLTKFLKDKGY